VSEKLESERRKIEKNKERLNQGGECEKVKGGERMGRNWKKEVKLKRGRNIKLNREGG
jgi:hypothetical protein